MGILKKILKKLFKMLFNMFPVLTDGEFALSDAKRIFLFFSCRHIGDSVIFSFFAREFRKFFPDKELVIAAAGDSAFQILNNGYAKVIHFPYNPLKLLLYLRREKFDAIISLPGGAEHKWQAAYYFSGAKAVILEKTDEYDYPYARYFEIDVKRHKTWSYMRLLSLFSTENPYSGRMSGDFVMPGMDSSYEANVLGNGNLTDFSSEKKHSPVILFNPESSSPKRSLSPKKTLSVAKKILENSNCRIRILSYKYKIDLTEAFFPEKLSKRICIAKADSLHKLFAEIKNADYLLTVETSSAHIGEMYGKPMTALFKIMLHEKDKCGAFNFIMGKNPDGINLFEAGCFPCEENYDKKRCMECSLCSFFVRNSNADMLVGFDCQENIPDNSIALSCLAGLCSLKR